MCIFPSDGISRIRFTGLDAKIHSQPVCRLPEDYLFLRWNNYSILMLFVNKKVGAGYYPARYLR